MVNSAGMSASEVGGRSEVGIVLEKHHNAYCPSAVWGQLPMFDSAADSDDEEPNAPGTSLPLRVVTGCV